MPALWNSGGLPWWYARPFYLFLFKSFLLAIVALAAALWWTLSVQISGLSDYNVTSAQFIRERNDIFLVPPEWIRSRGGIDPDRVARWMSAEMKARAAVVFILWAGSVSFFIWQYSRRRAPTLLADKPVR